MRILDGFRLSIRRKLGRCLGCLRLALGGAVVAWIAAAAAFGFVGLVLGWILAAVAVAFTAVAVAHLAALAVRAGPGAAFRALRATYMKLGCGCDNVPVGFGLEQWYATKDECEASGIPAAYGFAADQADQFCNKSNYECIDKDCPWLHWVNNTSTADCKCEQAAGGRWKAICDLVYKTQCCCSPEL